MTKITSSMSFGLFLDVLTGSRVTEDEETTATSGPDEAVRSGGVMERLIHDTGPFPGCCCGLLHPQCSHQCRHFRSCKNAQIYTSSHFNSTISFDFSIRSNKMILLYIFVSGFPFFPHKCHRHLLYHKSSAENVQKSRIRKVL